MREIKEAVPVKLTAICTYFEKNWEYNFDVIVEPAVKDKNIQREEAINEALADQESKTAGRILWYCRIILTGNR